MSHANGRSNIEHRINTKNLRAFLCEAGVSATLAADVMGIVAEYLGRPECPVSRCFLVEPTAPTLTEECIDEFLDDIYRETMAALAGRESR
jgi:hypothetical protein